VSKKIRVGLLFGGRSAEHQVSLQSAKSILAAIDTEKYEVVKIGITSEGQWLLNESIETFINGDNPETIALQPNAHPVTLVAGDQSGALHCIGDKAGKNKLDVLFPILHGPYGEDGSVQGLARLANIPCVGSGTLSSAIGMDKDFTKRILMQAGIDVANFITLRDVSFSAADLDVVESRFPYPVFVKPANMGSSIGVSKANNRDELAAAVELAFQFDRKLLVEEGIVGRELECAVLGNDFPKASVVGEIISSEGFYDYQSKYIDENGAKLSLPAAIPDDLLKRIQTVSVKVFQALECRGLARVDMFVTSDEKIIINEINTLPGFTKISMYPKLWEASGLSYSGLIDTLISLAIEDFQGQR
jgi:D-alanine-D-alanine ligase